MIMIAAFVLFFGGVLGLTVLVMVADYQRRRVRIQALIRSEQNREIIGDGAWWAPK